MRASYFGDLIRSYQEKDKWLRVLGLVLSSGALGSALLEVDQKYKVIASLIAAACSYWLLVSQYSTFSREASDLMSSWQTLATRYEKLWNNLDAPEAECTFDKIYEEADKLSKPAGKFPHKGKRLEHWFDKSVELLMARYSTRYRQNTAPGPAKTRTTST